MEILSFFDIVENCAIIANKFNGGDIVATNKSLILDNPNITLKNIGYKLGSIQNDQSMGGFTIFSNWWGKPRPNSSLAKGDNRQMIFLNKNQDHFLLTFGANRVVPSCVSIGKKENSIYYLVREIFNDDRDKPLPLQSTYFC